MRGRVRTCCSLRRQIVASKLDKPSHCFAVVRTRARAEQAEQAFAFVIVRTGDSRVRRAFGALDVSGLGYLPRDMVMTLLMKIRCGWLYLRSYGGMTARTHGVGMEPGRGLGFKI